MSDSKSRKTPPYSPQFLEDSQDEESYTESDSQADFTILSDGTRCYIPRPPPRPVVVPAAVGPVHSANTIITGNAEPSSLLEDNERTAGESLGTNKQSSTFISSTSLMLSIKPWGTIITSIGVQLSLSNTRCHVSGTPIA
ncbi:hypothetical protein D9613_011992 [Agrocybe pediades]|uniref:Uncharacterized protein n=1 Tax=Agrocybe pediades TaxID=84607 RepID=A0A8H4QEX6_9AGAR|nr:hypothetical protein D9613_011992 [Agrocybe pediades]